MGISNNKFLDNMGGINVIYPIKTYDIVSFGSIRNSKVGLFEVSALEKLDIDNEKTKFSEDQKESNAGNYFEAKLSGFFLKDQYDVADWFNQNINRKYVVVIVYNNGIIKVAGTPNQPLKLRSNPESGTFETLNGFNILFSKNMPKRAYYLDELPTVVAS